MTRKACVIGWPISHSRSPLIHGYWLKRYGIDGSYERVPVAPADLSSFLNALDEQGYVGCNVTLPHKEQVFAHIRSADKATERLRAINTVYRHGGGLWGTNTDGEGFLANLSRHAPQWLPGRGHVVILGAGGSARAIIGALLDAGVPQVAVVNRSLDRALDLQRDFGAPVIAHQWPAIAGLLADAQLVVNTTSLGMTGQPPLLLDLDPLPRAAIVADIVYSPLQTDLLRRARQRGHGVVPGLGMLLHQAVRGFELWFGRKPEVTDELHDLVARDIDPDFRR